MYCVLAIVACLAPQSPPPPSAVVVVHASVCGSAGCSPCEEKGSGCPFWVDSCDGFDDPVGSVSGGVGAFASTSDCGSGCDCGSFDGGGGSVFWTTTGSRFFVESALDSYESGTASASCRVRLFRRCRVSLVEGGNARQLGVWARGEAWVDVLSYFPLDREYTFVPLSRDVTEDGIVDAADLAAVLDQYGTPSQDVLADVNLDGIVDGQDVEAVLDGWGTSGGD
jgi:hypothetical protein